MACVENGKFSSQLVDTFAQTRRASELTVLRSGLKPNNLVDRAGGRRAVDRALTDVLGNSSNNRIGFFVEVDSQGNLATRFTSGTINYANPNIRARIAPPEQGLKC